MALAPVAHHGAQAARATRRVWRDRSAPGVRQRAGCDGGSPTSRTGARPHHLHRDADQRERHRAAGAVHGHEPPRRARSRGCPRSRALSSRPRGAPPASRGACRAGWRQPAGTAARLPATGSRVTRVRRRPIARSSRAAPAAATTAAPPRSLAPRPDREGLAGRKTPHNRGRARGSRPQPAPPQAPPGRGLLADPARHWPPDIGGHSDGLQDPSHRAHGNL